MNAKSTETGDATSLWIIGGVVAVIAGITVAALLIRRRRKPAA
jgi:LPXTG-motif cell wall-anchored protein